MPVSKFTSANTVSVVKSVGRVLDVFELMRQERRPMTGTEIGSALGLPKSSTNAILKSLVALGYMSLDRGNMTYFSSLRVAQLGDWIPAAVLGSGQAINLLEDLHIETRETITLSMQNDLTIQFLRVIKGSYPIALQVNEGFVAPLFGTSVGNALLASKSEEEILSLIERANAKIRRVADRLVAESVMAEIQVTRSQGYSTAYDRLIPDSGAIAMPLPQGEGATTLIVAVAGLNERIRENEKSILRLMRSTIKRYF